MNEKYSVMTPFDITYKMLGPYMFSATSRETLNDKMELYFHDHSFMPLFMHVRPNDSLSVLVLTFLILSTGKLPEN